MNDDRRTALNLAHHNGWSLFPLAPSSKVPAHGFPWRDDSTNDPTQWQRWFDDDDTNIGLDCGKSGIVVVDIDPRGGGVLSTLHLARLDLLLRSTLTQHTRGDGLHLIYQAHPGHTLSNTAGQLPGAGKLPGIDLRGGGGYIVYATSRVDGKPWRLIDPIVPLALAPSWMREPDVPSTVPQRTTPETIRTAYVDAALRDEAARVGAAPKGTRNHTLNAAAFSLGQLIGAAGLTEHDITAVLTAAADASGLTRDDGARQVESTIESGIRGGTAKPRRATA